MESKIRAMAAHFLPEAAIKDIRPYGSGRVNDTLLVTAGGEADGRFILQRLSPRVFPRPDWIMENLRVVEDHLRGKGKATRGFQMARLRPTLAGSDYVFDEEGACWRMLGFIEGSRTLDRLESPGQAVEAGRILGLFHRLLSDLEPASLHDTLPGFHVTPAYLAHYDRVAAGAGASRSTPDIRYCQDFIGRGRSSAPVLEEAVSRGELCLRPMHGDPKLSNILFDEITDRAVSLIDLDTVKPGLIQYDLGDCLRSCCNLASEEAEPAAVRFELSLCRLILQGYLAEAGHFLTPVDCRYFYDATRLIAFELGLRFFTDYLAGNVYFKTTSPEQNLQRALAQFALTASIERQEREIAAIIRELCPWK